jgi:hypothetical protein
MDSGKRKLLAHDSNLSMEGNKMSTEEIVEAGPQEGPAWETVAKYATYEEADQKRLGLAIEEDIQVKVHWQGISTNRYFAVKTREDPSIALEEAQGQA